MEKVKNEVVKQSDIRRAKILALAALGQSTTNIAKELGMSLPGVSRVLQLQASQEHLSKVIQGLNDELNQRLPVLLTKALQQLEIILDLPGIEYVHKLKAIELTIKTATKLSELSLKSKV